jgi:hypothetical protein
MSWGQRATCGLGSCAFLITVAAAATTRAGYLITVAAAATGLTACASSRTQQARPQPIATIGDMQSSSGAVLAPRDLYPRDGKTEWIATDDDWMRIEDGVRTGTLVRAGEGIEWREPLGTTTESVTGESDVRLRRTIVPGDKAISVFDPPLLLVSAEGPGPGDAAFETETPMRVEWIDGGERDRGEGFRSSRILGTARIRTPAGDAVATVVENTFEARLKMARARRVTTLWIVPGEGPVAERWSQTVFVFGIPTGTTRGAVVRSAPRLAASGRRS